MQNFHTSPSRHSWRVPKLTNIRYASRSSKSSMDESYCCMQCVFWSTQKGEVEGPSNRECRLIYRPILEVSHIPIRFLHPTVAFVWKMVNFQNRDYTLHYKPGHKYTETLWAWPPISKFNIRFWETEENIKEREIGIEEEERCYNLWGLMTKDSCEPINTGNKGNHKFCLKAIVPTCNMQYAICNLHGLVRKVMPARLNNGLFHCSWAQTRLSF